MVWDHSLESLHSFIDALNSFHPTIKFTYTISSKEVNFLDVTVTKSNNLDFVTEVYVKSTNIHQYVEYSSCHPKGAVTYHRIALTDAERTEKMQKMFIRWRKSSRWR